MSFPIAGYVAHLPHTHQAMKDQPPEFLCRECGHRQACGPVAQCEDCDSRYLQSVEEPYLEGDAYEVACSSSYPEWWLLARPLPDGRVELESNFGRSSHRRTLEHSEAIALGKALLLAAGAHDCLAQGGAA